VLSLISSVHNCITYAVHIGAYTGNDSQTDGHASDDDAADHSNIEDTDNSDNDGGNEGDNDDAAAERNDISSDATQTNKSKAASAPGTSFNHAQLQHIHVLEMSMLKEA
jgi:hypothetical protein